MVNVLIIADICNFTLLQKIALFIPILRIYFFYKAHKHICEQYNLSIRYALGMTFLPALFYGKLIYK